MQSKWSCYLSLLVTAGLSFSCGVEPTASTRQSAMTCSNQKDKVVTTDYLGAREEVRANPVPESIGHAAAVELLWSQFGSPANEQFAVAWIKKNGRTPYVRRYSTEQHTKDFVGPEQQLDTWSSPGWIQTLGFDDDCAEEIPGSQTCAWFTWQDDWGYVNWKAIGNNGGMSGLGFFSGLQPSGDTGHAVIGGQVVRKKLLAWITSNRLQVKAQLLYNNGLPIPNTEVTLQTLSGGWKAYQTVTAWSSNENRWLVAWSENNYGSPPQANGLVRTRYVNFNGVRGNYVNGIMYCEGIWDNPSCSELIANSGSMPLGSNPHCVCKGLWLASSWYSQTTLDRYRIHQYMKHARLNAIGIRQDIIDFFCGLFCPITEAGFWYGADHTPFQCLDTGTGASTVDRRLVEGTFGAYPDNEVFSSPFGSPQAFRSDGSVAAALATDDAENMATALKLSIVDVSSRGCPP